MDIAKFSIGFLAFILVQIFKISSKTVTIGAVGLLILSLFIASLSASNVILQISTLFDFVSIGGLLSIILIEDDKSLFPKFNKAAFVFYISFLVFKLIQNLHGYYAAPNLDNKVLSLINPWGHLMVFLFVFCHNSKSYIHYLDTKVFRSFMLCSGFVFFIIIMMIKLDLLEGNTEKVGTGQGGLALKNLSTNETALLAICHIIYFLYYIKQARTNKILFFIAIALNAYILLLSESRVGIISFVIALGIYFYGVIKKGKATYKLTAIVACLAILPLLNLFVSVISSRNQNDESDDIRYSTWANTLGTSFSGRIIVWQAYEMEYMNEAKYDPVELFIGAPFYELSRFFTQSYLPLTHMKIRNVKFFPLHSDLLFLCITSGILGSLLWLANYLIAFKRVFKNQSFLTFSCFIVFTAFFCMDMFNYSLLSSLLVGLGMAHIERPKVNLTLKFDNKI